MSGAIDLRVEEDLFELSPRGRLGYEDIRRLAFEVLDDKRMHAGLSGTLDLRAAQVDMSFVEITELLASLRDLPRNTRGRIAIVAADPVAYGLSRTFAALQDFAEQLQVFSDYDAAAAWTGQARVGDPQLTV